MNRINRHAVNKIAALLLLLTTVLLCCIGCNNREEYEIVFTASGDEPIKFTITSYSGKWADKELFIPTSHNGYPVVAMQRKAFLHCSMKSLDIGPLNVIPEEAFMDCYDLESINFRNIREIHTRAFDSCTSLTKIVLPDTLKELRGGAFSNCVELKEVYFMANPQIIEDGAFRGAIHVDLYAPPGGTVEAYAKANNLPFHPLPDEIPA